MRTIGIVLTLLIGSAAWADEPRDLVAEARAHEMASEWQLAADSYRKLEAFDDWRGFALYREGWSAFQQGDFVAARQLAAKAMTARRAPRAEARELYGDALFKLGEFERARNVYVAIEKTATQAPARTMLRKKIAACDRMLTRTT